MWELDNLWTHEIGKSITTPMASSPSSYLSVTHEIQVLLVDHDSDSLINTAKLLELCQYRVTLVELASGAIQTLLAGKVKFDIVMANVNSPDLHVMKLMQHATSMDIPVILMSFDENTFMAMRALEHGAFLYVKKPASKEMLKYLWQDLVREKINKSARERERERLLAPNNYSVRGIEFREAAIHPADDQNPNINVVGGNNNNMLNLNNIGGNMNNNMLMMDKAAKLMKKNNYNIGGKGGVGDQEDYGTENRMLCSKIKRKVCTEWTQELHEKFMDAVEQLGEGRCFPKEILELMNVPELTRMQVASHLQKCRNDNWRSPDERKSNSNTQNGSPDSDHAGPQKPRRFGSMPKVGNYKANSKETSGGGTVGEGSKTPQSEAEIQNDGGVENMESEPPAVVVMTTNNNNNSNNNNNNNNPPPYHHPQQQYIGPPIVHHNSTTVNIMAPLPAPAAAMATTTTTTTYSANPSRNTTITTTSDDHHHFFNFTDMDDSLVHNYSAGFPAQLDTAAAAGVMNNGTTIANYSTTTGTTARGYHHHHHFEPVYRHHDQVPITSVNNINRSQWMSSAAGTTSNFGSDHHA